MSVCVCVWGVGLRGISEGDEASVCVKGVRIVFDETSNSFNYFITSGVVLIIHLEQAVCVCVRVCFMRDELTIPLLLDRRRQAALRVHF